MKLYGFFDAPNTGDYNNVEALYHGLQGSDLHKEGLLPNTAFSDIISEAHSKTEQPYRLILVGEKGAAEIGKIPELPANVQIFWTGHQTNKALEDAVEAGKVNTVLIANSGISRSRTIAFERNATVVKLPGVPVEMNEAALIASYRGKEAMFLPTKEGQKRIVFFVGGDAPDLEGGMRYIPEETGSEIGTMLAKLSQQHGDAAIEIVTGPRTGQFDPETGKETYSHDRFDRATGEALPVEEDKTTQGIRRALEDNGLRDHEHFQIHNFRWGTQKLTAEAKAAMGNNIIPPTSMYDPAMGLALSDPTALVLYTGESITEGNKCAKYLVGASRKNYAIAVPSMHEGHAAFMNSLAKEGYIGIIDAKKNVITEALLPPTKVLDATLRSVQALQARIYPAKKVEIFR